MTTSHGAAEPQSSDLKDNLRASVSSWPVDRLQSLFIALLVVAIIPFFVNLGDARAAEVWTLIHLAHATVKAKFGVDLELEVELVGEWTGQC